MTEKEFKNLKEGDKVKTNQLVCYALDPNLYIPIATKGKVVKTLPKKSMIYCNFGEKYDQNIPIIAFEVDLA